MYSEELTDILELQGIEEARVNKWDYYNYNNSGVPRVTNIISQCRDSEWLIKWAANIGRRKYDMYSEKALDIGTIVHELIDCYLMDKFNNTSASGLEIHFEQIRDDYRSSIWNALENFKLWDKKMNDMGYPIQKLIGIEIPISCPWFGGTVDGIVTINGANYLIDFKTSKKISSEYLVQVSAYMWLINNGYAPELPHIDGIGLVRVDKAKYGSYEELFLNDFDPIHHNMIQSYQDCFMSYLSAYYRTINIDYITDKYKSEYNSLNVFYDKSKEAA